MKTPFRKRFFSVNTMWFNISITGLMLMAAFWFASCKTGDQTSLNLTFVVSVDPASGINHDKIIVPWDDIVTKTHSVNIASVRVKDLNNDQILVPEFYDTNDDKQPDYMVFAGNLLAREPMRPFEIITTEKNEGLVELKEENIMVDESVKIIFLTPASEYLINNNIKEKWAEAISKTIMESYPDPANLEIFAPGQWTYTNGFFTNALSALYEYTGNESYFKYVQNWLDLFILDNGQINP